MFYFAQPINCIYTQNYEKRCISSHCRPNTQSNFNVNSPSCHDTKCNRRTFYSSRQAVSKHIKILAECELVSHKQQGREIYYQFNPQKMKEVADWLSPFQQLWETRFDQLDELLNNLK